MTLYYFRGPHFIIGLYCSSEAYFIDINVTSPAFHLLVIIGSIP